MATKRAKPARKHAAKATEKKLKRQIEQQEQEKRLFVEGLMARGEANPPECGEELRPGATHQQECKPDKESQLPAVKRKRFSAY